MPVSEGARRRWCVSTGDGRDKIAPIRLEEPCGGCRLRLAQKLSPDSSGSIATSSAASRHRSAGLRRRPSSSKMRTSFRLRPSGTRTCSRAALALSGRSTTSVTPTPEVTVNRIAWERPSLWLYGRSQTHINEISFQPPQARRVMISRIKRLKVNSSRPGCAVGGKSKPSSYSRAASVEDCDTLSTPEVCDALSKREVLIAV